MSKKRAAILAAITAGAMAAAAALPAGATHQNGYSQSIGSGLSLPGIISTGLSPQLCVNDACQTVPIQAGNPLNNIQLGLAYEALRNTTHLPSVSTAAGSGVVTCQAPSAKAGQTVEGIILGVTAGDSTRFTSATVSLSVNGESKLNRTIGVEGDNKVDALSVKFGLC